MTSSPTDKVRFIVEIFRNNPDLYHIPYHYQNSQAPNSSGPSKLNFDETRKVKSYIIVQVGWPWPTRPNARTAANTI